MNVSRNSYVLTHSAFTWNVLEADSRDSKCDTSIRSRESGKYRVPGTCLKYRQIRKVSYQVLPRSISTLIVLGFFVCKFTAGLYVQQYRNRLLALFDQPSSPSNSCLGEFDVAPPRCS